MVWASATPFVATRYPKRRGRKRDRPELLGRDNGPAFLAHLLREELRRLVDRFGATFDPDAVAIEPLPEIRAGDRRLRPLAFRRQRRKASDDGGRRSCGAFRITLPHPLRGPLALGHSSHFGLGLFFPARSQ